MTNKSNPLPVNNAKPIKEFLTTFNSDLLKNLSHVGSGDSVTRLLDILHSYGYTTPRDYKFGYSHSTDFGYSHSNDIVFSTAFKTVFKLTFYSNKEVPIDQMMMQIALQLEVNVVDVTEF